MSETHVVLIGFMASGKSTLGPRLAQRLRRPFVDLDDWIAGDQRSSIADIFDRAGEAYPCASLETSGPAVGLPPGQMGNSEVGHMTMGAGRVIDQDITRITREIEAGGLANNVVLAESDSLGAGIGRCRIFSPDW